MRPAAGLFLALTLGSVTGLQAQEGAPPARRGRVELSVGGGVLGGQPLGTRTANLRANLTGADFPYFQTRTRLDGAPLWTARVGVRLAGPLSLEVGGSRSRPDLRTEITDDFEQAAPATAGDGLTQWTLEGSARLDVRSLSLAGGRVIPYLRVGGAHLQESGSAGGRRLGGHSLFAGLGPRIRLGSPAHGLIKELGVRLEGRLAARRGGVWREERYRIGWSARGELLVSF